MNFILKKDIDAFAQSFDLKESLSGSKFLITGATGLIGSTLVRCLLAIDGDINIVCPVRNKKKAETMFGNVCNHLTLVECDLVSFLRSLSGNDYFDYIIHCASPTAGKYMVEHPVETYELAYESTQALLRHSMEIKAKGMVLLSSLEYYGQNMTDQLISEDLQGYISPNEERSSYPLGKRAAEYLCAAYAKEYGVNAKIARLTQTFGAGVSLDDNRVFAQFARSVINNSDIILHTSGESAKPYCYTTDAISAILYILLKGKNGEAYNVANEDTYISIKDLAYFIRDNFNDRINVKIELNSNMGYAPTSKLNLSTKKLRGLGWSPKFGLKDMFSNLINSIITS